MYKSLLLDHFPVDEAQGLFKVPHLPATRLGRLLRKETRIASPNDVLAMHEWSGFLSGGWLIFTADKCYYEEGELLLEDVRSADAKEDEVWLIMNLKGEMSQQHIKVKNETVAKAMARMFGQMANVDPVAEAALAETYDPAQYNAAEIDWLKLRDEVMKTIDLLYARYNDGKLSILEFESKKEELLGRL